MTSFFVVAHQNSSDHPTHVEHTFFVETVACDDAAGRVRALATRWPESAEPDYPRDPRLWVFLGRVTAWNGPDLTPEVREWQRQWLRDYAGLIEGDKVNCSVRSTTMVAMSGPVGPWWRRMFRRR